MAGVFRLLPFNVVTMLFKCREQSRDLAGDLESVLVEAQRLILRGESRVGTRREPLS